MANYNVRFELAFSGEFEFETDDQDALGKADEYLYDCWYNMIDRPDTMRITGMEKLP